MSNGNGAQTLTIQADQQAQTGYLSSYPLSFDLRDAKNDQPVLYITDNPLKEHALALTLQNVAPDPVQFSPQGMGGVAGQASPDRHHLELIFRANTISAQTLNLLKNNPAQVLVPSDAWSMAVGDSTGETLSIYLLYTKDNETFTLAPQQVNKITLLKFSAASGRNARSTQVEVKPSGLSFVKDPGKAITSSRLLSLYITDHEGTRALPMHLGFHGPNRILKGDPSNSAVTLQLMNIAPANDVGSTNRNITFKGGFTTLDLTADIGSDPWALCQKGEAPSITFSLLQAGKPSPDGDINGKDAGQGQGYVWSWQPDKDYTLAPGDSILFTLKFAKCTAESGQAKIYLCYSGIPGYWDGQLVCAVEKSPLMFSGVNVGIGTSNLHAMLDVMGNIALNNSVLYLKEGTDPNHGLGWYGDKKFASTSVDGPVLFGNTGGALGTHYDKHEQIALTWDKNGNVGIGTTSPAAKLDVAIGKDDNTTNGLRVGKDKTDYLTVFNNGNVGIGNATPKAKLDVAGLVRIGAETDGTQPAISFGSDGKGGQIVSRSTWAKDALGFIGPGDYPNRRIQFWDNVSVDGSLEVKGRIKDQTGYVMPVGTIVPFADTSAPEGWLVCDGNDIPADEKYKSLRDLIGGKTPDLRGRTLIGAADNHPLRTMGGEEMHTLTKEEMPAHSHSYTWLGSGSGGRASGTYWGPGTDNTGTTGGSAPHNNMPPFYVVNYIIKF